VIVTECGKGMEVPHPLILTNAISDVDTNYCTYLEVLGRVSKGTMNPEDRIEWLRLFSTLDISGGTGEKANIVSLSDTL